EFSPDKLASYHDGETQVVLRGRLTMAPDVTYQPVPRTSGQIVDQAGQCLSFTIFGNTKETVQALKAHAADLCLIGRIDVFNGYYQLKNVEVLDDMRWAGRLRPRYPGKSGVISADTVRERVLEILSQSDAFEKAASYLLAQAGGD